MKLKNEKGFILPLAILLVIMLSMSGAAMLHLQFLELRSVVNETSNQSAFYLASTGMERARGTFKIPDSLSWTSVLDGSNSTNYPRDTAPNPLLCPDSVAHPEGDALYRGCVIPPYQTTAGNPTIIGNAAANGSVITSPDPLPFSAGVFDKGLYSARAFNDEPTTTDNNGIITIRALGNVNGEQKLLEVKVKPTSDLNLMNCSVGPNCPEKNNPNLPVDCVAPYCLPSDGRDPEVGPVPILIDPNPNDSLTALQDTTSYYRTPSNFSSYSYSTLALNDKGECTLDTSASSAIFFCSGKLIIESNTVLTNSIVIGVNSVVLKGSASLNNSSTAPLPYPTIISDGNVVTSSGSGSAVVYGTVYSSSGTIDLGPTQVHGVLIGSHVALQGFGSTVYTDDNNQAYYGIMPGFHYPDELKKSASVVNTWREIQ